MLVRSFAKSLTEVSPKKNFCCKFSQSFCKLERFIIAKNIENVIKMAELTKMRVCSL